MLLRTDADKLLAQVYLNIGYSYAASTQYQEALDYFKKGRQRWPIEARKKSQGLAYALGYEAMIFGDRGAFRKAEDLFREGMELVERFTLGADGRTLSLEATTTDPVYLTAPVVTRATWEWVPGETVKPWNCAQSG